MYTVVKKAMRWVCFAGIVGSSVAQAQATPDQNKDLIIKFYEVFYNAKNMSAAKSMMTPQFINHHPFTPPGADGTVQAIQKYVFDANPNYKIFIRRIIADKDMVWVHSYSQNTPEARGGMTADIWRIQDGKVAEHWDVNQPIPEGIPIDFMQ